MTNVSVATTARLAYEAQLAASNAAGDLDVHPDTIQMGWAGEKGTSALTAGHPNLKDTANPGKFAADSIVDFPAVRQSRQVDVAIATFGAGNVVPKAV